MLKTEGKSFAPTALGERIRSLDIIRGFALTGVFLVNFQSMISWEELEGTLNIAASDFINSLVVGKFYRLFAFLFGVGFVLQMRRLEARGAPFVPIYLRRLLVLLLIGLLHGMLLWQNDILALFAQFGILLLLIRRVSFRWLLVIGILCLFAAPLNYYISTGFSDFIPSREEWPVENVQNTTGEAALWAEYIKSEGSYREVVAWTTKNFIEWQTNPSVRLIMLREEFLMFLLGLYFGRRRIFENPGEHPKAIARIILGAIMAALICFPLISWLDSYAPHAQYGHLAITFRQIMMALQPAAWSLTYGLSALYFIERFRLHRLLAPIGSMGRMALTNYILLSGIITTLFYGYGFGMYGHVTVFGGVALAVVSYILLAAGSAWWLNRFRFGPAEWAWRSLTYGSLQPLKS